MYSMTYFGKFLSNFRDFYNEINASTLTGAIDVIVVEQPDGSFTCSPFHVRFGKLGVLRSREKVVDIEINGTPLDLHMKLGESGEAFFVEKVGPDELGDEVIPAHLACSPIPGDGDSYESFEKSFVSVKEQEKEVGLGLVEEIFKSDTNDSTPTQVDDTSVESPSESTVMNSGDLQSEITFGEMESDSQIQPKTFRAETSETKVSEIVRKVKSVTGEFRPIDMEPPVFKDEEPLEVTDSTSTHLECAESQLQVDKKLDDAKGSNNSPFIDNETSSETYETTTESIKEPIPVVVDKRRRRKKSFLKKKSEMRSKKVQENVPNGILKEAKTSSTSRSKENLLKTEEKGKERRKTSEFSKSESDGEERSRSVFPESESGALTDPEQNHGSSSDVESGRGRKRASIDPDFHFFSDTEATPGYNSQREHRCTPVQSDSEIEKQSHDIEEGRSWRWGELPTPPQHKVSVTEEVGEMAMGRLSIQEDASAKEGSTEAQRSMLTSMFSFMRRKHLRQHPTDEGIYLSDINPEDLDPEVAALYFPSSYHQGFTEPGGHSNEVEHITKSDEQFRKEDHADNESGCGVSLPHSPTSECSKSGMSDGGKSAGSDMRPDVLKDIAMSLCGGLEDGGPKESVFLQKLVLYEDFVCNPKVINDPNLVVRFNGKYYNWKTACPLVMSVVSYRKTLPQSAVDILSAEYMPQMKTKEEKPPEARRSSWWSYSWRKVEPKQKEEELAGMKEETLTSEEALKEEKTEASGSMEVETEVSQLTSISEDTTSESEGRGQYRKTLRLSSEVIAGLHLQPGQNEVEFTVTSAYQGTSRCRCHIYRWRWDDKIVISDIDGTITKSDVLGHILPIVGKDWAQNGVAQLFTKIMNNGYKVLYLSARAIGQAGSTRDYLRSIKQEDLCLPDGPLLLSPTGLLSALHREVIEKKPEEFKISCLRDIEALFSPGSKPFYAGYGNKVNDVWAYRAVGIPMFRIFTINHRGELRHECSQTFQSSYSNMSYLVDQMFPPANTANSDGDYSNFVYWREPIQEVVIEVPDDGVKAN